MEKRENKLIFNSQQVFDTSISALIPLNYFVQVRIPNSNFIYSYYITPMVLGMRDNNIPNMEPMLTYAYLRYIPINFIVGTILAIPINEQYPVLDFLMILRSTGVAGKSVVAIKLTIEHAKFNKDGFIGLLYNKISDILAKDQYNLFTIRITGVNNISFENDVIIHSFIFTLRKKTERDSILDLATFKNPFTKDLTSKKRPFRREKYFNVHRVDSLKSIIPNVSMFNWEDDILEDDIVQLTEEQLDELIPSRKTIRDIEKKIIDNDTKVANIAMEKYPLTKEVDRLKRLIDDQQNLMDAIDREDVNADYVQDEQGRTIIILSDDVYADRKEVHYEQKILLLEQLNNVETQLNNLQDEMEYYEYETSLLKEQMRELENEIDYDEDRDDTVIASDINNNYYRRAGTYIPLPEIISTKCRKCILNIKNDTDKRCFYYTVNAWYTLKNNIVIRDPSNPRRPYNYNLNVFNWTGIDIDNFVIGDIDKFCYNNNLGIVLWELDDKDLRKIINNNNNNTIIPLIMYKGHIMLIKNLDRFWKTIASNLHLKKMLTCDKCIDFQTSREKIMDKHKLYECKNRTDFTVMKKMYKLPYNSNVSFKNYANTMKCRYILVADYEALLPKTIVTDIIENSYKINLHKPFMIGYALTFNDTLHSDGYFKGPDCSDQFLKLIDSVTDRILSEKNTIRSTCQLINFDGDVLCNICSTQIKGQGVTTSEFPGMVIHAQCYDKIIDKVFSLKVIFHNFKNYDSHFIIDNIFKNKKDVFTIPKTKEKYTTIQYFNNGVSVKFLDSYSFLQGSLDSLAKRLSTRKYGRGNDVKMTFPYEYIDSYEKLDEPTLPSDINLWYSTLKKSSPSKEDIDSTIQYFNDKGYKSIYEYATDYMMTDVFLLLEIIYDFKTTSFNTYGVDPLHYYTLPGYAWDVTLKTIDIKPCLLKDESMIDIIIENIRGGISTVSVRKWLVDDDNNSIFYFDANNLYGWSMSQSLPYDEFCYINDCEDVLKLILDYNIDDDYGYILTVDVWYPEHLYESHNELPFLPQRINDKLCLSLLNKKMYTCHILNLQQAILSGLQLEKVWSIIRFKQSKWLEKYISMNTQLRSNSSSESDKNFYKLMNNAVFGKTMQNPLKECKYIPVGLNDVDERKKMEKKISYKSQEQWTDNLILYEMDKIPVMDKPIYIGFVILELSKWKMYDTFYHGIKKKWPFSTLSYMDTDSFVINIPQKRSEVNFEGVEDYFDLSVYPKDSKWYNISNKGVLGKLKDEYPTNYIKEFICLRSKMYGINTINGHFTYKCKGISKTTILSMNDMRKNLKESLALYTEQVHIKSVRHELATWITNKKTLTNVQDDKRINIFKNDEVIENKKYLANSIGFIYYFYIIFLV